MKHYLDLVPISAKVHRKQSRMTKTCIILAVFLVTAIFGMADMWIQAQKIQAVQNDGSWHINVQQIGDEQAALLATRPEVETSAWYGVLNYGLDEKYQISGVETVICGFDEALQQMFPAAQVVEGAFPQTQNEAVITKSVQERLKLQVGDTINLTTPDGESRPFFVSGIAADTSLLTQKDAFGVYVNTAAYRVLAEEAGLTHEESTHSVFYMKFVPYCNIPKTIAEIETQFQLSEQQIGQNVKVLALMLLSKDPYMMQLYMTAAILAVLVTMAGVLMITSSLNSNVAQRITFFGMLRCLGAAPQQIRRFVRREALCWCKTAIPVGLVAGTTMIWLLCAMLTFLSPTIFQSMPTFGISWIGILSGIFVGLLTVLLAAHAPAKKAAQISPLTAVAGNATTVQAVQQAADTTFFPIEVALGIHHAKGSKKNFWLMVGSFAFSILLFLSFSASIDFMHHAITPLKPYTPDLSIVSPDNLTSIPMALEQELSQLPAVKRAYGRSFAYHMPVQIEGQEKSITLISYEEHQFTWAKTFLLEGSLQEAMADQGVLAVYHGENSLNTKQTMIISSVTGNHQVEITGVLSKIPFSQNSNEETIICSEKLFQQITGVSHYTIVDLQLTKTATDDDIAQIRAMAGESVSFSDQRLKNQETKGAYYSFVLFIYGFLAVIALISIFNIVNSIAMSVSARMRQYGAMRAIGMSDRQLFKMITAEAATYAAFGVLFGTTIGLYLHRTLYHAMVTFRWGDPWQVPVGPLTAILIVVACAVLFAVYGPAKRMRKLSVVETISAD